MIEHISLAVRNHAAAKQFYTDALAPLGYRVRYEMDGATGFMEGGHTSLWIAQKEGLPMHLAFRAESQKAVEAFYKAALQAGASDNGAPGYRPDYSPNYYAAFVHDPDGNNIEAVWYDPQKSENESSS